MIQKALGAPEWFRKGAVYQINPRTFSREGTIRAITKELPYLADLGFRTIYLCPIFEEDASENRENWSTRQKASETGNPKNPYRMKDYFRIDEEYGSMEDLMECIRTCHAHGMRLLLDLVYLHIGPNAAILASHPEFAKQNADGSFVNGKWNFPLLDFGHPGLREYLWSNMVYYIASLDADGFRCDVGDGVPLDFWAEGRRRITSVKPDAVLINEGVNGDSLLTAFNAIYGFSWHSTLYDVMIGGKSASLLRQDWERTRRQLPAGGLMLRDMDNHDTVTDWPGRIETMAGHTGMDLILALNYAIDGVPMVYTGNEIADEAVLSMFANRFHPGKFDATDRSPAHKREPAAERRAALVRQLNALRRGDDIFSRGEVTWIDSDAPDAVIAFRRTLGERRAWFAANLRNEPVSVRIAEPFSGSFGNALVSGAEMPAEDRLSFAPHGFILIRDREPDGKEERILP